MDFAEIIYEKQDRIATVTMNRPERMNAWTQHMGAEIKAAMTDADRDDSVRAIIVTGTGKAYCAGADMSALASMAQGTARAGIGRPEDNRWLDAHRADYRGQLSWVLALRKPVIAAINGACVGLGFTKSLYYDIRIASEKARLGLIFPQRGLAIEHGSSWMLPRIVGLTHAIDMAVTGRLLEAKEALAIGLVNHLVPDGQALDKAREIALDITRNCSPVAVMEGKRLAYEGLSCDLQTAVASCGEATDRMYLSEDFKEGIKSFAERRPPRFTGR